MMETDKIQDKIVGEFGKFSDGSGIFGYFRQLAEIGGDAVAPGRAGLDDSCLVPVRKRPIWLKAWLENDRVFFSAYSPSPIYNALLGIMLQVFSGRRPLEIINANLYVFNEIELYDRLNEEWLDDVLTVLQRIRSLTAGLKVYALT